MERAGVATVPGYHGQAQDAARFAQEADRLGYPVLIKATAGGGGRGMRAVAEPGELGAALDAARNEALSAFGNGQLILEKYLARPRHVEVQVFGDQHGHVVHLFERDCSAQRRHQKVIEESPAPVLDEALRRSLGATAVAAARAADYVGAGTVEFILHGETFYFIEMNTRLQVEHPVTEMVTRYDLVEWQLRVAAGEALPARQEQICSRGHAIEARLYAEDPAHDFAPASGRLQQFRLPAGDARCPPRDRHARRRRNPDLLRRALGQAHRLGHRPGGCPPRPGNRPDRDRDRRRRPQPRFPGAAGAASGVRGGRHRHRIHRAPPGRPDGTAVGGAARRGRGRQPRIAVPGAGRRSGPGPGGAGYRLALEPARRLAAGRHDHYALDWLDAGLERHLEIVFERAGLTADPG